ncbi:MAG: endonuclease [Oligoflexales bacterium]|nr:endonuclease [Oligoflexales bacterium]
MAGNATPTIIGRYKYYTAVLAGFVAYSCGISNSGIYDKSSANNSKASIEFEEQIQDYYATVLDNKDFVDLESLLFARINHQQNLGYSGVWAALLELDADPEQEGNVLLFYTGESVSINLREDFVRAKTEVGPLPKLIWNREHLWPLSRGISGVEAYAKSDLHHIYAENSYANSRRANRNFGVGGKPVKNVNSAKITDHTFEPRDEVKGDVARAVFYMAVRYGINSVGNLQITELAHPDGNMLGRLCDLLNWHQQDPVSEREILRNQAIFKNWQANRNPFIDFPEWVAELWSNDCINTRSI